MRSSESESKAPETKTEPPASSKPVSVEDRLAALEADYAAFKAHVSHIVGDVPAPPTPPAEE